MLFRSDEETVAYLRGTGRTEAQCAAFENYYKAQGLWGVPVKGELTYSVELELDLATVVPGVAGPKRPQDRINLTDLGSTFAALFSKSVADGGYGKPAAELAEKRVALTLTGENPTQVGDVSIRNGSVLIAAITSCTNTSNPSVMLGAGLLAKKAVELGLKVNPAVKSSLGPGSRVVTDYLNKTGLGQYLDTLGFDVLVHDVIAAISTLPLRIDTSPTCVGFSPVSESATFLSARSAAGLP